MAPMQQTFPDRATAHKPPCAVIGVEHMPELAAMGERNVRRDDGSLIDSGLLTLLLGDGRSAGSGWSGPFDAIHVGAAADRIPEVLTERLARGGKMVIPVGPDGGTQKLLVCTKSEGGEVTCDDTGAVMFVPLTSKEIQTRRSDGRY